MEGMLRNDYAEELGNNNNNRDLDNVSVEIVDADVEVATNEGDIIGNLNGANGNNFGADAFEGDEWMRQLQQQQQQDGLIGQGETSISSPQRQQFRNPYEQSIALSIPSPAKNRNINNINTSDQDETEEARQETDRLRLQGSQLLMPRIQSVDGLQQLQGVDNTIALNNLLQQQQSSLSNAINQSTDASSGTIQTLEQQLAALQQQQSQQQTLHDPRYRQPMSTLNLQESLLQLQKLQEQQQQILKNIGHTGLIDTSSLVNPLGTLLNTLMRQFNGNGSSNDYSDTSINNNSNAINHSMTIGQNHSETLGWGGNVGGAQQLQIPNNSLQSTVGTTLGETQQMEQDETEYIETGDVSLESRKPPPVPHDTSDEPRQRIIPSKSLKRRHSNSVEFLSSSPSPIIRKAEKKKPSSFPELLWDAMMAEGISNDAAFEWLPDGKSFVVVDSDLFCKEILDRKFKQSKYGSFVRKLHRWGFIRLTSGTGTDCFHHPMFQREKPELVTRIKCNSRNSKEGKKGYNAYASGEYQGTSQPSLMGVEKFIRAKVVSTEDNPPI